MAFSIVDSLFEALSGQGGTTASIDSTGSKLIVVGVSKFMNGILTDSEGNTWTQLTLRDAGNPQSVIFYAIDPTTSASHTFTFFESGGSAATWPYPVLGVMALDADGQISFSQENGSTTSFSSFHNAGFLSTTADNTFLFANNCWGASAPFTGITSGMTTLGSAAYNDGVHMGGASGYILNRATVGGINPSFAHNNATAGAGTIAAFIEVTPSIEPTSIPTGESIGTPTISIPGQLPASASNTLSLTDDAQTPLFLLASADNTLAFTDGAEFFSPHRVTHTYVEVAVNPNENGPLSLLSIPSAESFGSTSINIAGQLAASASNTLAFVDSGVAADVIDQTVNDTLSFVDTGSAVLFSPHRITHTYIEVGINPFANPPIGAGGITSEEAFGTPDVAIPGQIQRLVSQNLGLSDNGRVPVDIPSAASNTIAFTDDLQLRASFRATQQYVEVLTSLTAEFRATQQFVELLVNDVPPERPSNTFVFVEVASADVITLFPTSADNTVVFVDNATQTLDIAQGVSQPIGFTQGLNVQYGITVNQNLGITDAARDQRIFISLTDNLNLNDGSQEPVDRPNTVSDTIVSVQTATVLVGLAIPQTISDTVTFVDTGVFERDFNRVPTDTLALVDNAAFVKEFGGLVFADNTLAFVQDPFPFTTLRNELAFLQTATATTEFTGNVFFFQNLEFLQFVSVENFAVQQVTQDLGLTDNIDSSGLALRVEQTLNFVQSFFGRTTAPNTLSFTQSAAVATDRPLRDTLNFTDSTVLEGDFLRSVSQQFLEDSVSVYVDRPGITRKFNPFSDIPENRISYRAQLVLERGDDRIELRNPETDDLHRLGFQRVNYETSGGELIVFQGENRNVVEETLSFTVVAEKTTVLEQLQQFMLDHLGEQITVHTWDALSWRGVITNPQESFVEDAEGYWTLAFTFVGERSPGIDNGQEFNLTQDVMVVVE